VLDECGDLRFSLWGENGGGTALNRVGCTIELGGLTTIPE